ncbi:hypothetical protein ACO22_05024, partial [Paracoccidioides brasiliensis]
VLIFLVDGGAKSEEQRGTARNSEEQRGACVSGQLVITLRTLTVHLVPNKGKQDTPRKITTTPPLGKIRQSPTLASWQRAAGNDHTKHPTANHPASKHSIPNSQHPQQPSHSQHTAPFSRTVTTCSYD